MPKLGAILFLTLTVVLMLISVELFFIARAARDFTAIMHAPATRIVDDAPLTEAQERAKLKRDVETMTDRLKWLLNSDSTEGGDQPATHRQRPQTVPNP